MQWHMIRQKLFFILLFVIQLHCAISQSPAYIANSADQLHNRGEVYFRFYEQPARVVQDIGRFISIDHWSHDGWVYAYGNKEGFAAFLQKNIAFEVLTPPGLQTEVKMLDHTGVKSVDDWDFYPTYEAYIELMNQFQETYPDLCQVFSIGQSVQGREILFARISDNAEWEPGEAQFLYTSSMHGDEITGYVLMLRLIDHLLSNYGSDPQVTHLVNNLDIWINPLANPDGTYFSGNHTVSGAKRFNANNVDINRNFPDPEDGPNPDGKPWQLETLAFIQLAEENRFIVSANLHGGAEVCNYPWDTWAQLAADDEWWQYVCREYADSAQFYSPLGYMSGFNNGITNGYAWYTISGGRQDYMNYFHNCREFTLEISNVKVPPASQLPAFWEYNYRSFLSYMEQTLFGIRGNVTDKISGDPVEATVTIEGHDIDNSWVRSNPVDGWFFRPIHQGTYKLTFSAPGYKDYNTGDIKVLNRQLVEIEIELELSGADIDQHPIFSDFILSQNPFNNHYSISYHGSDVLPCTIALTDLEGRRISQFHHVFGPGNILFSIELVQNPKGVYLLTLASDGLDRTWKLFKN
jgi:hypothetical protein